MGKKDKNKKKVSGSVKTAMKTEKKLNAKHKKELAAAGEDDLEQVIAQLEHEERRRQKVVEARVDAPSRRVNFSLSVHPFKDELIMLGGEFHDGRKTVVYGDMFFYNIIKKEWTVMKAPGAPPPRCGHQTVATSANGGELWVFGGEFSSPSESQFYHYRDLWRYYIGEKKWQKITAPGGPSARSGHRMVYAKKQLIIFGGFHDNLRDYKYFNDVHIFNVSTYQWSKLEIYGNIPAPRSGCIILPTVHNKILIYGGYSKERIKKDVDKGQVHTDMFVLGPDKNDETGLKWRWTQVKQSGARFSPRCSASAILVQPGIAFMFGGVYDEVEDEEELYGTFFNELIALDMEKYQWRIITVSGKNESDTARRRRRKLKNHDEDIANSSEIHGDDNNPENEEDGDEDEDEDDGNGDGDSFEDNLQTCPAPPAPTDLITDDDGIFTMTIGPAPVRPVLANTLGASACTNKFTPSPRINPGLAVKNGILYLYGGMFEDGDRQYTLNDLYSLDTRKLNEWKTIIKDDLSSQVWFDSESSGSENDQESDSSSDDDEGNMEVEEG